MRATLYVFVATTIAMTSYKEELDDKFSHQGEFVAGLSNTSAHAVLVSQLTPGIVYIPSLDPANDPVVPRPKIDPRRPAPWLLKWIEEESVVEKRRLTREFLDELPNKLATEFIDALTDAVRPHMEGADRSPNQAQKDCSNVAIEQMERYAMHRKKIKSLQNQCKQIVSSFLPEWLRKSCIPKQRKDVTFIPKWLIKQSRLDPTASCSSLVVNLVDKFQKMCPDLKDHDEELVELCMSFTKAEKEEAGSWFG